VSVSLTSVSMRSLTESLSETSEERSLTESLRDSLTERPTERLSPSESLSAGDRQIRRRKSLSARGRQTHEEGVMAKKQRSESISFYFR